jgi:transcriptional antiterminator NusG
MNWYALYVRANFESVVAQKLQAVGIEGYYPHLIQRSKDQRRDIEKKFFPGYVFVRIDLTEQRSAVVSIPQVLSILGWGQRAIVIDDTEIEAVRSMVSTPEIAIVETPYVSAGDLVRVARGPLAGMTGFVVYEKSKARVVVSITGLGRSISAEVDHADIEVLDGRRAA